MWKKEEMPGEMPIAQPERLPERAAHVTAPITPAERATIGRSITIRGDVTGDEDLMIQGRVEGSVDLQQHSITVGPDGEVSASIIGRVVTIEGRVEGNIDGGEQVILRNSAFVQGDITAPRVVLENGARFRGLVDMGDADDRTKRAGSAADSRRGLEAVRAAPEARSAAAAATDNGKAVDAVEAGGAIEASRSAVAKAGSGSGSARTAKSNGANESPAELRL